MDARPEFDFPSAEVADILDAFRSSGAVLLRRFVEPASVQKVREVLGEVGFNASSHIASNQDLADAGYGSLQTLFFEPKHDELLAGISPVWVPDGGMCARRMTMLDRGAFTTPFKPHIDGLFLGSPLFHVNQWVALDDCGRDAPALAVVPATLSEVARFVGCETPDVSVDHLDEEQRWARFKPAFRTLVESGSGSMADDFAQRFGERLWTPEYKAGDCMMIHSWTLHFTHITQSMTRGRMNLELRFNMCRTMAEALAA